MIVLLFHFAVSFAKTARILWFLTPKLRREGLSILSSLRSDVEAVRGESNVTVHSIYITFVRCIYLNVCRFSNEWLHCDISISFLLLSGRNNWESFSFIKSIRFCSTVWRYSASVSLLRFVVFYELQQGPKTTNYLACRNSPQKNVEGQQHGLISVGTNWVSYRIMCVVR